MESERKEHLLEPLTDTEGCTVPFGVHVRAIDLQLPPLPAVSQRHRAISAGSSDAVLISKLDPLDSDYESAWDFAKPGVDKLDGQYSAEIVSHSKPGDAIFATTLWNYSMKSRNHGGYHLHPRARHDPIHELLLVPEVHELILLFLCCIKSKNLSTLAI